VHPRLPSLPEVSGPRKPISLKLLEFFRNVRDGSPYSRVTLIDMLNQQKRWVIGPT
jgi:hypothetical protein